MSKINRILGLASGVLLIVLAIIVFSYNIDIAKPSLNTFAFDDISSPSYELEKSYGGDAYTGIQQAAAQTANNLIPVFNAIEETGEGVEILNSNLQKQAKIQVDNTREIVSAAQLILGIFLLAMGLLVLAKYIDISAFASKKKSNVVFDYPTQPTTASNSAPVASPFVVSPTSM